VKLDDIRKLHQKKYRHTLGHFLVEGEHLVLELEKAAAGNQHWRQAQLYVTPAYGNWISPWPVHRITEPQMARLADTRNPQGIIAVAPLPQAPARVAGEASANKAIYLHEIQDPGNLGTILRTLAWFGGMHCLLSPGSVDPFNPKVVRASMGAIFHVPVETEVPLPELTDRYSRIACLDIAGSMSATFSVMRHADCPGKP